MVAWRRPGAPLTTGVRDDDCGHSGADREHEGAGPVELALEVHPDTPVPLVDYLYLVQVAVHRVVVQAVGVPGAQHEGGLLRGVVFREEEAARGLVEDDSRLVGSRVEIGEDQPGGGHLGGPLTWRFDLHGLGSGLGDGFHHVPAFPGQHLALVTRLHPTVGGRDDVTDRGAELGQGRLVAQLQGDGVDHEELRVPGEVQPDLHGLHGGRDVEEEPSWGAGVMLGNGLGLLDNERFGLDVHHLHLHFQPGATARGHEGKDEGGLAELLEG